MSGCEGSKLTNYDGGACIQKRLVDKKPDGSRPLSFHWLEFTISIMRSYKRGRSLRTQNLSFSVFKIVDELLSFAFATAILS